jgi:hypothetical protein
MNTQGLKAWWHAVRHPHGANWTWTVVLGVIALWLLRAIIDAIFGNIISAHVEPRVLAFLKYLALRPVGYVMLAALAWAAVLSAIALYESSSFAERRRQQRTKRRPLTTDEKHSIEALREDWGTDGNSAGVLVLNVLGSLIDSHADIETPFRALLHYPRNELDKALNAFTSALQQHAPLGEVKTHFAHYLKVYMEAVRWVHVAASTYPQVAEHRWYKTGHEKWERYHQTFMGQLHKLSNRNDWSDLQYHLRMANETPYFFTDSLGNLNVP